MSAISVIVVSWNGRDLLRECLYSVRDTGGSLVREIIVVDNASTDGSAEMVATQFPEAILIRLPENLGFARANNIGMQRASGSCLALVNSDVVVHPGCFERLNSYLDLHPGVGLVGPKIVGKDGAPQTSCRRLPTLRSTLGEVLGLDGLRSMFPKFFPQRCEPDPNVSREVEALVGCFWLTRRQAVDQVGGLDERFFFFAEDLDWCHRFRLRGWQLVFVPGATATHFGGGSSANAPFRFGIEMVRANLAYWRKYRGRPGEAAYYILAVVHNFLRVFARGLNAALRKDPPAEILFKFERSRLCLRWLLTGK